MDLERDDGSVSVASSETWWDRNDHRAARRGLELPHARVEMFYSNSSVKTHEVSDEKPVLHPVMLSAADLLSQTNTQMVAHLVTENPVDVEGKLVNYSPFNSTHSVQENNGVSVGQGNIAAEAGAGARMSPLTCLLNEGDIPDAVLHSAVQSIAKSIDRTKKFGDRGSLTEKDNPSEHGTQIYVRFPYSEPLKTAMHVGGTPMIAEDLDLEKRVVEFRERVRRPLAEKGVDSAVGQYDSQGRAVAPLKKTEEMDIDVYRERIRVHMFRRERIKAILNYHLQRRLTMLHGRAIGTAGDVSSPNSSSHQSYLRTLDEMQRRLQENLEKESEHEQLALLEREAMSNSIRDARLEEMAKKREMAEKNRESLKRAKEAETEREDRKARGMALIAQRKADAAAKRAAEHEEEKKRVLEEREKMAKLKASRMEKRRLALERQQELKELALMREEEELAALYAYELAEKEMYDFIYIYLHTTFKHFFMQARKSKSCKTVFR